MNDRRIHDAVEAVRLLLPIVRREYGVLCDADIDEYTDWKAAIEAGNAVIAADKGWRERQADTVARLNAINERGYGSGPPVDVQKPGIPPPLKD